MLILISASETEKTLKTSKKWKSVPCTKKDGRKEKSNYRPVNIFSNVSKVYERCLYDQIYYFFENKFSRYQCEFRKGLRNALFSMTEKMLLARDKREVCRAILTDLSKSFDCISHDLLIAKLNAYGFYHNALDVIHNDLFGRPQKTKVCSSFIDLLDVSMYCMVYPKVPY